MLALFHTQYWPVHDLRTLWRVFKKHQFHLPIKPRGCNAKLDIRVAPPLYQPFSLLLPQGNLLSTYLCLSKPHHDRKRHSQLDVRYHERKGWYRHRSVCRRQPHEWVLNKQMTYSLTSPAHPTVTGWTAHGRANQRVRINDIINLCFIAEYYQHSGSCYGQDVPGHSRATTPGPIWQLMVPPQMVLI